MKALKNRFSRQHVVNALRIMVDEEMLLREGGGRHTFYAFPKNADSLGETIKKHLKNKNLKEHEVLMDLKEATILKKLPENIESIFSYAFSEMLNNAIEHSESTNIQVKTNKTSGTLSFEVKDMGIGVFQSILKQKNLKSELEAIQDLLKGKTTTDPKAHSGEGIFFTSKVADVFTLESFNHKLIIDNIIDDVFVESKKRSNRGTKVHFEISTKSKKHLNDIFKKYQSEPDNYEFDKTEIKVKLYTMGTIYISRSQARRILTGLEKFKHIILDFEEVPTVGQAFADEVFRVFKETHPNIKITPINMVEGVEFMVKRAINNKIS